MSKRRFVEDVLYEFGDFSTYSDSIDLGDIEEALMVAKHSSTEYKEIIVKISCADCDDDITLSLVGRRKENDEERQVRLKREKEYKQRMIERKRQEYERLKAEFGDK